MMRLALLKTHFVCRPSLLESEQKEREREREKAAERKKGLLLLLLFVFLFSVVVLFIICEVKMRGVFHLPTTFSLSSFFW